MTDGLWQITFLNNHVINKTTRPLSGSAVCKNKLWKYKSIIDLDFLYFSDLIFSFDTFVYFNQNINKMSTVYWQIQALQNCILKCFLL